MKIRQIKMLHPLHIFTLGCITSVAASVHYNPFVSDRLFSLHKWLYSNSPKSHEIAPIKLDSVRISALSPYGPKIIHFEDSHEFLLVW